MTNKEAIEILKDFPDRIGLIAMPLDLNYDYKEALNLAIKALDERPQGEWIPINDKRGNEIACACSVCKKNPKYDVHSDFCPNCGAKMKGGETDE